MNREHATPARRRRKYAATTTAFLAAASLAPAVTYEVDLGDTFTENGLLSSNTGLVKTGLGALILTNNANSYTGATVIRAGSMVISNVGALGATSSISILNDGLGGGSSGQLVLGGTYAPQTFNFTPFGGMSLGGAPGTGAQALASVGNNTILGPLTVSSTAATRLSSAFGTATVPTYSIAAGVASTFDGSGHWALGAVTGGGPLQKQGLGTLVLTGVNTNSGVVDLAGGFVRVSSSASLGTSTAANAIQFSGGALEVRTDAPDFAGKDVSLSASGGGTVNLDRAIGGTGLNQTVVFANLQLAPGRNLTVNSRNGYSATFTGAGGTIGGAGAGNTTIANNHGLLTLDGDFWNNADPTARVLLFQGLGDTLLTGSILAPSTAAHQLTKAGTGTLTILGMASTYRGSTGIQQGAVAIRGFGGLGDPANTSPIRLGTVTNGVVLHLLGAPGTGAGDATSRPFELLGSFGSSARINANQAGSAPTPFVLSGNFTSLVSGTSTKTLILGGTNTLDNELSGAVANGSASPVAVTKTDPGTWVLSGTNTYTGPTTLSAGGLKIRANAVASTVVADASPIVFSTDFSTRVAGATLEFVGLPATNVSESLGILTPTDGANTVKVTPGAAGTASLTFGGLGGVSSLGASVNFVSPAPVNAITLTGAPTGFVRGETYYNGADFAYSQGGTLRAPIYGTDANFVTSATALTSGQHNQITGSFSSASRTVNSLKISGSRVLTMSGQLVIASGNNSGAGILQTGGSSTITGSGVVAQGPTGTPLVIRVNEPTNTLNLISPITSGTGGFAKNGAGTLILSGANSQTGGNHINEGTVKLAGAGRLSATSQALTIRQGAIFDLNGVGAGATVGVLNGAGTITNTGSAASLLTMTSIGTFTGVIEDGANPIRVVKYGGQTNQMLLGVNTYSGSTRIADRSFIVVSKLADIGQPSGIGRGNPTDDASNAASLIFGDDTFIVNTQGGAGGLFYNGSSTVSINRLFTFGGSQGIGAGGTLRAEGVNGAAVIFNKTNPITYTASANTVPQTLGLVAQSTGDNRINLRLVDPTGGGGAVLTVSKMLTGAWVLGNDANSYTGPTHITGGRLVARDGFSLPSGSPLIFGGGNGSFVISPGVFQSSGNFTRALNPTPTPGSGGVLWTMGGGFAASDAKLTVNLGNGTPLTWGSGGFVETTSTITPNLLLNSTTSLFETEFKNDIDLNGDIRTVQIDDNGTTSLDFATLSGVLSGAGAGLDKTGTGTLQLLGANTYTGETRLNSGTLVVTSLGSNGSTSSSVGAGAVAAPVIFTGSATLRYVGTGESSNRPITPGVPGVANPTIESSGSGALVLRSVSNAGTAARTLTLRGTNSDANEITSALSQSFMPLTVTKTDGGTWILSGANTYTGNTNVVGGILGIGHDSAIGLGTLNVSNARIFADGADRSIANDVIFPGNSFAGVIGDHSLTISGDASFGGGTNPGNATLTNNLAAAAQFEITGTLSNGNSTDASSTIIFDGTGRTVLSGEVADGATARATHVTNSNGTLVLSGASTYSGATIVAGGKVIVNGSLAQTASVMVDGAGARLNVNGSINPGAVTTIVDGTLSGTGSLGPVITSAATTDAEISPGNSIGILTVQGTAATPGLDLSEGSGAVLSIELGKVTAGVAVLGPGLDYDQIVVTGDTGALNTIVLGFDATLDVIIPSGLFIDEGDLFFIAVNIANDEAVNGTFDALPEGATVLADNGTPFTITYAADWNGAQAGSTVTGGNDIALIAVPEPGGAILALGGLGLLAGLRRKRA